MDDDYLVVDICVHGDDSTVSLIDVFSDMERKQGAKQLAISYWVIDEIRTRDEIVEQQLRQFYGAPHADWYRSGSGGNTEWTGNWNPEPSRAGVGGHNILQELQDHDGRYLHLEIRDRTESDPPDPPRQKTGIDLAIEKMMKQWQKELVKKVWGASVGTPCPNPSCDRSGKEPEGLMSMAKADSLCPTCLGFGWARKSHP